MRPAEDLAGREGAAGFDDVMQRNRSMAPGAQEQQIQAGQRALAFRAPAFISASC